MQRNSMNQDNDRIGSNGYRQMNRGYENDQQRNSQDDDRYGSNRSFGGYDDNQHAIGRDRSMSGYRGNERSMGNYRDDEPGYGGSQ
ncbi:MAG: hypothetical protein AB7L94_14970, partial [Kofleriaceae bacterium]